MRENANLPPRVLLVHPGTQHAARLAESLDAAGLLQRFWTGAAVATGGKAGALPPSRGAYAGRKNRQVGIGQDKLRCLKPVEYAAQMARRTPLRTELVWHLRNWIFQWLVPTSEICSADIVVGYDTASWVIAKRAKHQGKRFILDRSIGDPSAIPRVVEAAGGAERVGWKEASIPRWPVLACAEREEHSLADVIVVPGEFCRATVVSQGVDPTKIHTIPYGVADDLLEEGARRFSELGGSQPSRSGRKFTFLYAGYLSPRKGVPGLLKAWADLNLGAAELRMAGGGSAPTNLPDHVVVLGQIPRAAMVREMQGADAFVFPSLFEGFALVLLEAMASGLPVITTPNAVGGNVIEDGKEGLLVAPGDVDSLKAAMRRLAGNPALAAEMGRAAHEKAKHFTWGAYGSRWVGLANSVAAENTSHRSE